MKKVLITGKDGYIANSFIKYLSSTANDIMIETISLRDDNWKSLDFSAYNCILHLAGIAHQEESEQNADLYYQINRDLTIALAGKAASDGAEQFIFVSSLAVYGLTNDCIYSGTETIPTTHYGKSKLEAEQEIAKLFEDINICVVRPPMVYGKGCKGNYTKLKEIATTLPIFPNIKNNRSMIYIENLCEFLRLMIVNNESGTFLPQNNEYVSTTEMTKLIASCNNHKLLLTKLFNPIIKLLCPYNDKLNKAFGSLFCDLELSEYSQNYNVCSFEESIKRTEN